jgi:hypothetical protein
MNEVRNDEGALVGGGFLEFRGQTTISVWLQVEEWRQGQGYEWTLTPGTKRDAKRGMRREFPSRDWVLRLRFDK